MNKSEQINELASALAKAQAELESAKKDSKGHGYSYSDLATVIEAAKTVLPKHGLSFSQLVGIATAEFVTVTTILMHSSGQFISNDSSIKIPEMRGVNDTQKQGAALSYLRRYSLQALLGMASEDNDAASDVVPTKVVAQTKTASNIETVQAKTTVEPAKAETVAKTGNVSTSFRRPVANGAATSKEF